MTRKNKPFRRERKLLNYDDSRFIGRRRNSECGECAPVIDSLGIHRFSSPHLFRCPVPGGAGGFRLGGFSHAARPAAFTSISSETGSKTPAAARVSSSQSHTGGNRRPATIIFLLVTFESKMKMSMNCHYGKEKFHLFLISYERLSNL